MQKQRIRMSEGYGELRAGNLANAMQCFVETLASCPELAKVNESNIRQTQRYFRNKAKEGTCDQFIIVSISSTQTYRTINLDIERKITGRIDLKKNLLSFNGNSVSVANKELATALANFAAQNPATHIYDAAGSPESLLLAWFYRLIWKAQVYIAIDIEQTVTVEEYIDHFADLSVLAQLTTYLKPGNLTLIQHLGRSPAEMLKGQDTPWSSKHTRIVQIYNNLVTSSDEQFLSMLFELSLGRPLQSHENKYYSELLQHLDGDRQAITREVSQSEECQRWESDNARRKKNTKRVYTHPLVNEIEPTDINLPYHGDPLVSVLIPVYGKVEYTLACLKSIADYPSKASFEVIVMDDCTPDDSVQILQRVKNLQVIVNPKNLGFLRSCNNGSFHANGEYLLFLNNDTQVKPGWLDELVETYSSFPGCGLAGSKLIYPDGSLQEAGGIIWQDGSAWNYGNRQDPELPLFNYAREVDYVSGASILVPAKLFSELGGFDDVYAPAYCEDADLALKIRDRGHRVIYQPLSEVVHFEGITSGTDTSIGVKAFQVINTKTLYQRWQSRLANHRPNGQEPNDEKDRGHKMRVLVVDHCTPTPNQDAGSVMVYNLLLLLREMGFQISFIPEDNFLYMPDYTTALQRVGIEALYSPYITSVEQHLIENGSRYDLVFLFRPGVVDRHMEKIRKYCTNAKVLYHTVDLHYLRMTREAQLLADKSKQKAADEMQQREFSGIRSADASIVVSTVELEILRPLIPHSRIHVIPLILDVTGSTNPYVERKDLIFVGGYQHTPNVDAVNYFVAEIMPLLRKKLPGVRFHAVGSKPPAEIEALAAEDVIITGFVEELAPLLDKMRVSIAPLRYGAGIKGKIGSAMAAGLPVVATSLAAEGMSLTDGENILIADGAEAFASTIAKIYKDEALWKKISQYGLTSADNAWGAEAAWGILANILRDLGFVIERQRNKLSLYSSIS